MLTTRGVFACSVEDLMLEHKDLLGWEVVSDEALDPKSHAFSTTGQTSQLGLGYQSPLRVSDSASATA